MPARGVAKQRISAVMRARRSRFQHARRWERGRLARPANRARKTYPFEGEGREWGDSARAGICELWLGDWYKSLFDYFSPASVASTLIASAIM